MFVGHHARCPQAQRLFLVEVLLWRFWKCDNPSLVRFPVGSLHFPSHHKMCQRILLLHAAERPLPAADLNQVSWEHFHGAWLIIMVLNLAPALQKASCGLAARLSCRFLEIAVCTVEKDTESYWHSDPVAVHRYSCARCAVSCARTAAADTGERLVLRGRIPQLYPLCVA